MVELKGRKVIVLASSIKTLRPILLQLWEHGVEFQVVTTVVEIVKAVTEVNPEFIMLAFDHPKYKNVVVLNEHLKKNKNIEVIGFVENDSVSMLNRLTESGLKYTLQPPITVPFITRILSKIIKENPDKFSADRPPSVIENIFEEKTEEIVKPIKFDFEPLASSLQQAIDDQCGLANNRDTKSLRSVSQIQCAPFICESEPYLNGLLIATNATSGITSTFNLTMLKSMSDLTAHWLDVKGYTIQAGAWFTIPCEDIDFTNWALTRSKLFKSCFHENEELGFSFFTSTVPGLKLKESARPDYILAPLTAFEPAVILPFDIFVDKDLKEKLDAFAAAGAALSQQQISTLKNAKVETLLIAKNKEAEFLNFAAECFLRASIDKYNYQKVNQEIKGLIAANRPKFK
jgi:hypothetical protein